MSCGSGCVVKPLRVGYAVSACSCRCWFCPECGPRRKAQVRDQIRSGNPTSFMTLTWRASRPEPPPEARRIMARAWRALHERIKRAWPTCAFEYFIVVEATLRGFPHFHVAMRAPYIPQAWLSEAWAALIDAPVVDIRAVRTKDGLAVYLAKYLAKGPTKVGGGKRYWCSQGYRSADYHEAQAERAGRKGWWSFDPIDVEVGRLASDRLIPVWRDRDFCVVLPLLLPPEYPP